MQEVVYVTAGRQIKIPKRYLDILILYYRFAWDICEPGYLSFDEVAASQIYVWESLGRKQYRELFDADNIDPKNGYYHGKRWLDTTITSWIEDMAHHLLAVEEIEQDFGTSQAARLLLDK